MAYPKLKKFRIIRKICKKLCFTLYEAQDLLEEKTVFVKILDRSMTSEGVNVFNFLNAARMGSLLEHDNICKIYFYGKDGDHYVVVSEYYEYKTLSLFIHEEFPLALEEVINIMTKVADALRYAHLRGVVHGLLNPSSIYISRHGDIKIDDFHYYWLAPHLCEIADSEAMYLSYHIAPEFVRGLDKIDGRVDIYSLGVVLLQLLTDYIPFNYFDNVALQNKRLIVSLRTLSKILPDYPRKLDTIILKSLNKNPNHRFLNLKEFEQALSKLESEYTVSASPSNGKQKVKHSDF